MIYTQGIDLINNKLEDKFENIKHVLIVRAVIEAIKKCCCRITRNARNQVDNDAYDDNEIEIIRSKRIQLKTNGFRRSGITNESIRS